MAGVQRMTRIIKYFGWRALDKPEIASQFLKPLGAILSSEYVRNGSHMLRLLRGRRSGDVDIISPSTDFGPVMKAELETLLEPLDLERLPSVKGLFDGFKAAPWRLTGNPLTLPVLWGDSPVVYNPKTVQSVPSSYADLADPYWKGRVVIRNEMYCVLWMFSAALGHPDPMNITLTQLSSVRALARAIKENTVRIAGSYREMTDMLVRGEADLAVSGWQPMVHWADAESGVELRFDTPARDPRFWWVDGYSIMRDATNKDLAYDFINHMLTPEINALLAWDLQSCSVSRDGFALMHPRLQAMYDSSLVQQSAPLDGPLTTRLNWLPPRERIGDVAGDADWQAVWLEFMLS
jgi:spermidine/putrescine-binding protein